MVAGTTEAKDFLGMKLTLPDRRYALAALPACVPVAANLGGDFSGHLSGLAIAQGGFRRQVDLPALMGKALNVEVGVNEEYRLDSHLHIGHHAPGGLHQ